MSGRHFVVQHDHNPTMFLRHGAAQALTAGAVEWTFDIAQAHPFKEERYALRFISNWLNGKGYVLPVIEYRKAAA